MKKIRRILFLSLFAIILFNTNIYSQNKVIECGDLDFDGRNERIEFVKGAKVDGIYFEEALKQMDIYEKNKNGKYVKVDTVKFSSKEPSFLENVEVLDLNKKDRQKEVIVDIAHMDGDTPEVMVFDFKNNKLKNLRTIGTIHNTYMGRSYMFSDFDKVLTVFGMSYSPIQHIESKQFKLINGILKDVTPDETDTYGFSGPRHPFIRIKATMKVKTYKDNKFTKVGYTIQPGEYILVTAKGRDGKYLKAINDYSDDLYIPITPKKNPDTSIPRLKYIYFLRDYKNVTIDNMVGGYKYAFENDNRAG